MFVRKVEDFQYMENNDVFQLSKGVYALLIFLIQIRLDSV